MSNAGYFPSSEISQPRVAPTPRTSLSKQALRRAWLRISSTAYKKGGVWNAYFKVTGGVAWKHRFLGRVGRDSDFLGPE